MITLSIIIPLFNKGAFVHELLSALLPQLQVGDEIVVVDDVSTDDGPDQVSALAATQPPGTLRLLRQPYNDGPATARNAGAAAAVGNYLLFFDADDLPHPCLLALLRQAIARYPDEVMFAYDLAVQARGESANFTVPAALEDVIGSSSDTQPILCLSPGAFVSTSLHGKPLCTASSTCVQALAFREIGGFQAGLRYCEDPELWARLSSRYAIVYLPMTLAVYRDVPSSLSYGLRAQPGSVQPYVDTLLALSRRSGDDCHRLAQSFITRNVVFSLTLGAPRRDVWGYLSRTKTALQPARGVVLRLLPMLPRYVLRLLFHLRDLRTRCRNALDRVLN